MSLLGNVARAVTQATCNVTMACVDGATDITEAITGETRLTTAVRRTSSTFIRGMHDITLSAIHASEEAFGTTHRPSSVTFHHENKQGAD